MLQINQARPTVPLLKTLQVENGMWKKEMPLLKWQEM